VSWRHASPKANVVVGVVGIVVVAIGNPAVVGVVVPTAPAIHAVRALWTEPQGIVDFRLMIVDWFSSLPTRRNREESHLHVRNPDSMGLCPIPLFSLVLLP
jgi:hypothetical protein